VQAQVSDDLTIKSITAYRERTGALGWMATIAAVVPGAVVPAEPVAVQPGTADPGQGAGQEAEVRAAGRLLLHRSGSLHDYVTFAEGLLQVDGPNRFKTENYAFFGQVDYRPIRPDRRDRGRALHPRSQGVRRLPVRANGFNYKLFGAATPMAMSPPMARSRWRR
jgi:hypothetical protein